MQEIWNFGCKINVISNGLEKYTSFNTNHMLIFTDSFQFLSSLLDLSVESLSKDDFKYLSQEIESRVWYLVKQKVLYLYEYMSGFDKFKERLSSKEKFYSSLTDKKISDNEHGKILKFWDISKTKKKRIMPSFTWNVMFCC